MRTAYNLAQRAGRAFVVATLALGVHAAQAYSVSLAPTSQTVLQGAIVQVKVTAADVMPGGLGSFDFTLGFDGGILALDSVLDGGVLGVSFLGWTEGADTLDISDISFSDSADLLLQQDQLLRASTDPTPSLTLFTLNFRTIGFGTSGLSFTRGTLSDVTGAEVLFTRADGSVTVLENLTVPVPGTLGLVLAACLAGAVTRRRLALPPG